MGMISHGFSFDPAPTGLTHQVSNASEYSEADFPETADKHIEREIKYIVPKWRGLETFLHLHRAITADPFNKNTPFTPSHAHQLRSNIFHADPEMCGRDILLSIGLDKQDLSVMRQAQQQVRTRGRINLDEYHKNNSIAPNWQFTIKDLLSTIDASQDGRMELEPHSPSQDVDQSIDSYLYQNRKNLSSISSVYNGLSSSNLFETSVCVTPRGSFNILVHVPDMDAFVAYETCCDPNRFFSPHQGQLTGKDLEIEMEAKKVFHKSDINFSDQDIITAYKKSRSMIHDFMTYEFPDLELSTHSKMERAMISVGEAVFEEHKTGKIRDMFQKTSCFPDSPFSDERILPGLQIVTQQQRTARQVSQDYDLAQLIVSQAEDPTHFLKAYGPFKQSIFETGSGVKRLSLTT